MTTISDHFTQVQAALALIDPTQVMSIANLIRECQARGGTIWLIGNGGSAATASHFACDLQKQCSVRAIALTDNMPLITAWGNDTEFDDIFYWQLNRLRRDGDVVVFISCSGTSPNLSKVVSSFAFTSQDYGQTVGLSSTINDVAKWHNINIAVDSNDYPVIEDCHLAICHAIVKEIHAKQWEESRAQATH